MRQKQFVVIVIVDCNAKGLKVMDRSNRGVQGVGPAHCVLHRRKKSPQLGLLAEAVRFELTEGVNPRRFSRPVP